MWIKCSERMPKDGMFILAFGPDLGEYVDGPKVEICKVWRDSLWNEGGTELFTGRPMTHWMPLPEPPGDEFEKMMESVGDEHFDSFRRLAE